MSQETALSFWLSCVERRGAILEAEDEKALVLLPADLQADLGLPEEVVITGDADVAREDGGLLLIPGHPLIDGATEQILAEGDAGHLYLPWPRSVPPTAEQLLARARDQIGVDHGRIDISLPAVPAWLPVLRLGAQVVYTLHDRFQEREEVWLDGLQGLPLSDALRARLEREIPLPEPDSDRPVLRPDLERAVEAAESAFKSRTLARRQELARQAESSLRDEIARSETYYASVLAALERRREGASDERVELLRAQSAATEQERHRRQQEIEEKFQVRHEVRPFRIHLLLTPAIHVPITVRRGARAFPFALTWLFSTASYLPVRCPHCEEEAPLVAGRDRLGCHRCLKQTAPQQTAPVSPPSPRSQPPPSEPMPQPPRSPAARPAATKANRRERPEPARPALEDLMRNHRALHERVMRVAPKFGTDFWQAAILGESWPRKRAPLGSPLSVLHRLYGAQAPFRALGFPPGEMPHAVSSRAVEPSPTASTHATLGWLEAGRDEHPFTLRWQFQAGKPAPLEVLPGHFPNLAQLDRLPIEELPAHGRHLLEDLPLPRVSLDPVEEVSWRVESSSLGLPFIVRCLAVNQHLLQHGRATLPPEVLAAAVAGIVDRWSGVRRTRTQLGQDYQVRPTELRLAAQELEKILRAHPPSW